MEISPNSKVVFQGDSITDSDRDYRSYESLGTGYVMMASNWFSAKYPEMRVTFLNRGVSGNRVKDLRMRWKEDCLKLKPNIVSILIGVNDTIGKYFWGRPTYIEDYKNDYRVILQQTSGTLGAKIILLEPFLLKVAENEPELREDMNLVIEATRELSKEFDTYLVPLDRIFQNATNKREPAFWSADGIHPSSAGHALIAQSWLRTMIGNEV